MARKSGLGKGIGAIIPDTSITSDRKSGDKSSPVEFHHLPVSEIERNTYQPRIEFDEDALEELAASIREHGVIQPITVRRMPKGKGEYRYELISGERRLRASKKAKQKTIPAYIREANDEQMLEMALIENIQREDLNPIEVAESYSRLIVEMKLTQEDVADKVGKKRSTVTNFLSLLKMGETIQVGLKKGLISMGHAKALKNFANKEIAKRLYEIVVDQSYSVRHTELAASAIKSLPDVMLQSSLLQNIEDQKWSITKIQSWVESEKAKLSKPVPEPTPISQNSILINDLSNKLEEKFGNKVKLKQNPDGKGEISISFASTDDLNRILEILDI
ncbi:MAG: ParB/RepB/Spo0J family partition protein [Bacteroidia bacterium]|nr:ParB/RepB/Spo0J family partition protein [Bacteroidia bacterium]